MVGLRDTIRSRIANTADKSIDQLADLWDSRPGKIALILTASAGLAFLLRANNLLKEDKACLVSYLLTSCPESSCSGKKVDAYLGKKDISRLVQDYYSGEVHRLNINCYK
ncbi:MAG TPA: hypothetical protein VJH68_05665 [Candidatus Nanoarchaeia archaeon]|nr:hypothetical protein [Candidatus Nanoarchaeia archaeon]